jgi:hypothetical protein
VEGRLRIYEMCGRRFAECGSLKKHIWHTGKKAYLCNMCGKRFTLLTYLKTYDSFRAEITSHYFTQEKNLSVAICVKCFTQKNNLKFHIATHAGMYASSVVRVLRGMDILRHMQLSILDRRSFVVVSVVPVLLRNII